MTWDWAGSLKPQIDLAASVGANTVRVIGDVLGVLGGSITLATYRARWAQLIDYADSVGLWTYACGGDAANWSGTYTPEQVAPVLVGLGEEINGRSNVIAYDIAQESHTWVPTGAPVVVPAVQAVCDRPITFSLVKSTDAGSLGVLTEDRNSVVRPWVDFFDFHVYYTTGTPTPTLFQRLSAVEAKPVLVGEFGLPTSYTQAEQEAYYNAVLAMVGVGPANFCLGSLAWSIRADDFGLFTSANVERTYLTSIFQQFPT